MCRFIAYLGKPLLMDELLFKPKNSLIRQSIRAIEAKETLNGDGFGVGWYDRNINDIPAVFTSISPAWNDSNLENMAHKIQSNCIFAHVRSANVGTVSHLNCHPFYNERFLFMHNGKLSQFASIKRHFCRELSDESYDWIKGQTDSEHLCALFLDLFRKKKGKHNCHDIAQALIGTVHYSEQLLSEANIKEPSYMNLAVTDGERVVAIRRTNVSDQPARSLYYTEGDEFKLSKDNFSIHPNPGKPNKAVLIASEKLTPREQEWQRVPEDHILMVEKDLSVEVYPF